MLVCAYPIVCSRPYDLASARVDPILWFCVHSPCPGVTGIWPTVCPMYPPPPLYKLASGHRDEG